ncbi:uncharacterized protein PV07_02574 [Cladophialophora immunda]|uniref:Uncharacterized protein n=1 Tax=Cladophialophora immunda TaxID=569365 RepID=A0A0D2B003_9EURO|nr:uncharacterized protein PV07_02574 [Cladophialophora immunda]KIW30882.1 hypothetical protein PV07_02574 [Cladophialophora immunda]
MLLERGNALTWVCGGISCCYYRQRHLLYSVQACSFLAFVVGSFLLPQDVIKAAPAPSACFPWSSFPSQLRCLSDLVALHSFVPQYRPLICTTFCAFLVVSLYLETFCSYPSISARQLSDIRVLSTLARAQLQTKHPARPLQTHQVSHQSVNRQSWQQVFEIQHSGSGFQWRYIWMKRKQTFRRPGQLQLPRQQHL